MKTTGGEKNGLTGGTTGSPAIWIYPESKTAEVDVEVDLEFHGGGYMTSSTPEYNGRWRIHIDPSVAYNQYSSTFVDDVWKPFLDYDGFRAGNFQKDRGWCVRNHKDALVPWHRKILAEYGLNETEIDDINYSYVRMLLDRAYPQKNFFVYPQDKAIVDKSVTLKVTPAPTSMSRLWLYFVPTNEDGSNLKAPPIERVRRDGYSVIEVAYLTEREIPKHLAEHVPTGTMLSNSTAPLYQRLRGDSAARR